MGHIGLEPITTPLSKVYSKPVELMALYLKYRYLIVLLINLDIYL